jgi:outer membrane protein TolC
MSCLALFLLIAGCQKITVENANQAAPTLETKAVQELVSVRKLPNLRGTGFGDRIATAVQTNPRLAAGDARVLAATANLKRLDGAYRPTVSLGASLAAGQTGGDSFISSTPLVSVKQLIYDGGSISKQREGGYSRVEQTRAEMVAEVAALTYTAIEVYYDQAKRQSLLEIAQSNLVLHQRFLEEVQALVEAGSGVEIDLAVAESRLADATARVAIAEAGLTRSHAKYREVFGTEPGHLPDPVDAPLLSRIDNDQIISQSPRWRSLAAGLTAAKADVGTARAARLPNVFAEVTGRNDAFDNPDLSFGISLQYDLATGGRREAAILAAEARVVELEASLDDLRREITRGIAFVASDRVAGAAKIAAARVAVDANVAVVEASAEQFTIGRRSIRDVLDAQKDALAAREVLIEAEVELALSGYAALALTGDILNVFGIDAEGDQSDG